MIDQNNNEESEEQKLQRLSDEEFARTGIFRTKIDLEIKITQQDMEQDLVKRTEGKKIDQDGIWDINNN